MYCKTYYRYGLELYDWEVSILRLFEKKRAHPHLRKGEWDGCTIAWGKTRKQTFKPGDVVLVLFHHLLDAGYMPPPPRPKKTSGMCSYVGCEEWGTHPHHITYSPSCVKRLCPKHHREITAVNINESDRIGGKLSNKHRWWAFGQWMKGELQPIFTPHVEQWLASWRD